MKFKFHSISAPLSHFPVFACAWLHAAAAVNAASATWLATPTNGTWAVDANWTPASAPGATTGTTNTDTATFGNSAVVAVAVDATRNLQNITFTSSSNTYTLSGGPLLLTSGGTISCTNAAVDQRISAPLQIQGDGGTYRIQTDTPGTNRELIISTGGITGVATAGQNTALTLAGASGGSNEIAFNCVTGNGSGGGTLSLVKEGTGLWILSAGNTYSGGTTLTGGTLRTGSSGNSSTVFGPGAVTMNGGSMRFQSSTAANFDNPIATTANGGFISMRANSTFNPSAITGTGPFTLTADTNVTVTITNFRGFPGIMNLGTGTTNYFRLGTGYVETSLAGAALNLAAGAQVAHQAGTNSVFTTQIGTLSGAAGSSIGGSNVSGSGTIVLSVGGRNESSTFAGTIVSGLTKTGLTKVGSGKLTATNYNTYTGPTSVTGGILSLTNAYLSNTAAVSIEAGAVMDLNFDDTDVVGSLSLGGSGPLPDGTYNSSTPTYGAFFTGSGSLKVGATAYSNWATTHVNGQSPSLDFDRDGVSNGVEFFFGETGSTFTANPGIVTTGSVRSVTWPMSASFTGTYLVETSANLVAWTDVTGSAVAGSGTLTYTFPDGEPKLFVRLTVLPD